MKRLLFFLGLILLSIPTKALFVAGPNQAGSISISALAGSSQTWRDINEAASSDDSWAVTADSLVKNEYTDDLMFQDFGFSLPSYAVILGIQVILECHRSSGNIQNYRSRLIYEGSILSTDVTSPGLWPTPNDKSLSHGGVFETWGASWNGSQINAGTFGYVMGIDMTSNDGKNHTAYVDQVSILVYYEIPLAFEEPIQLISLWEAHEAFLKANLPNLGSSVSISVERSQDGRDFQLVGKEVLENVGERDSFLWKDPQFPTELDKGSYYRIAIQPVGASYSLPSNVSFLPPLPKEKAKLSFLPQISQGELHLHSKGTTNQSVSGSIYSMQGQLLWQQDFHPGQVPIQTKIPIASWAPGRYYLFLHQEDKVAIIPISLP